ncbi:hypothetical protein ACC772_20035 [Rhizobium ruizarguesonis]|jgi:hypothetical protein
MGFRLVRQLSQEQNELVDDVFEGKITPNYAEAMSIDMGHGPIAEEIDYKRYQVGSMPAWTLAMSIAWILWRDIERVTLLHDPYRENNFRWEALKISAPRKATKPGGFPLPPVVRIVYELKRLKPASFSSLAESSISNSVRDTPLRCKNHHEAKTLLWDKLISGEITATALDATTGKFKHVEPRQWTHLDFGRNENARHMLNSDGTSQIKDVHLLRADVQSLWPEVNTARAEPALVIPKGKRGPKAKYDSELFIAEAIRFIDYHGGFGPADDPQFTRATVARHMAQWCSDRWDDSGPEETWRKKHLKIAVERYERGRSLIN